MVIFRKETKKKKCKQEHTLHFGIKSRSRGEKNLQFLLLLVLSPDAGEGFLGRWGPGCFSSLGKGGEGIREEPRRPFLPRQEELRHLRPVGRQDPPFGGGGVGGVGWRRKWRSGKFWS